MTEDVRRGLHHLRQFWSQQGDRVCIHTLTASPIRCGWSCLLAYRKSGSARFPLSGKATYQAQQHIFRLFFLGELWLINAGRSCCLGYLAAPAARRISLGRIHYRRRRRLPIAIGDRVVRGIVHVDLHKPHEVRQLSGVSNPASDA
jgi:hypothetical protein